MLLLLFLFLLLTIVIVIFLFSFFLISVIKGIKQRRACLYPVLETCYDAVEHEKALRENEAKPSFLSALRVFCRVIACF